MCLCSEEKYFFFEENADNLFNYTMLFFDSSPYYAGMKIASIAEKNRICILYFLRRVLRILCYRGGGGGLTLILISLQLYQLWIYNYLNFNLQGIWVWITPAPTQRFYVYIAMKYYFSSLCSVNYPHLYWSTNFKGTCIFQFVL